MYWRVIPESLVIVVHSDTQPTDEEWDAYLDDISGEIKGVKGVLVYAEKVGPSAPQRARSNEAFKRAGVDVKIAIMTGSRAVRGMVTALGWALGSNIKAFTTKDFAGAVKYFELNPEDEIKARVVLKQLARGANTEVEAFADESGRFRQKYR